MSAMNDVLCSAIERRERIAFRYGGGERWAEPHLYGISSAGNEVVLAWQVDGHSRSRQPVGWKKFRVRNMARIAPSGQRFLHPRPDYNANDKSMRRIFCQLKK